MCKNSVMPDERCTTCTECNKRAQAGPHYDPRRGTGRTTQRVKTALIAALAGHRVLYVTATEQYAKDLCKYACELLDEAHTTVAEGGVSPQRITLKNGGWLQFSSMSSPKPRGLKQAYMPTAEYWDHYAEEERDRKAREQERLADGALIKELMRKHGWSNAHDHLQPDQRSKLEFRT